MATGISKTKWGNIESEVTVETTNNNNIFLSYDNKKDENEIITTKSLPLEVVWCRKENNENIDNQLYYGDNLYIMASLLENPKIRGNVRLVYIDPPFSTRSVFQSRDQSNAYTDILSGSNYIEFLRQRLIMLRELLADDGSIYVHLDQNMAFHIKIIMDEIFGIKNFRNWITRKKCNPKNYTRNTYGNISDFILFYTKTDKYVWHRPLEGWTTERAAKEYQYIEESTGRRYKKVPIHAPGIRHGETGKSWKGMEPPPGKHWQYIPAKLDEMDARGEIYWSPNGNPRRKVYLDESEGVPVQDIWLDYRDAYNQNIKITGYPTEKNPDMLAMIIEASSNPGDLVMDCFCGSGTTLDVASKLGRNWIGIDNSKEAILTTLRRFSVGTKLMGDFVSKRNEQATNKEKKPNYEVYSMFDSLEDSVPEGKSSDKINDHSPISDFVLLSDKAVSYEMIQIVREWQNSVKPE